MIIQRFHKKKFENTTFRILSNIFFRTLKLIANREVGQKSIKTDSLAYSNSYPNDLTLVVDSSSLAVAF